MAKGFDTTTNCEAKAASIAADGYGFVARYYNTNNHSKNLTLSEAKALSAAGLNIVAVWENGFPNSAGYFSHAKGVHDGVAAYHYAADTIGQPAGTPIYFAVDFDASPAQISGVVADYFRGVADGFNTISSGSPKYGIGVYGSGCTCSSLLDSELATFAWLAMSTGWCGFHTFTKWNIKQSSGTTGLGISSDNDVTNGNGGGFQV